LQYTGHLLFSINQLITSAVTCRFLISGDYKNIKRGIK
jgi:hypothetical protein